MRFTGDVQHDKCPITLTPVTELEHPVGFDPRCAYECDALIAWLRVKQCNPITSEPVDTSARFVDVLHAMIIDEEITSVPMTEAKLRQAGWIRVTAIKDERVKQRLSGCIQVNTLVFLIYLYMSSLAKLRDALGEPNTTFLSLTAILCSLGVLVYDVCKTYSPHGWWIMSNFCIFAVFEFVLLGITGIWPPCMPWIVRISIIHSGILTTKLMLDFALIKLE